MRIRKYEKEYAEYLKDSKNADISYYAFASKIRSINRYIKDKPKGSRTNITRNLIKEAWIKSKGYDGTKSQYQRFYRKNREEARFRISDEDLLASLRKYKTSVSYDSCYDGD